MIVVVVVQRVAVDWRRRKQSGREVQRPSLVSSVLIIRKRRDVTQSQCLCSRPTRVMAQPPPLLTIVEFHVSLLSLLMTHLYRAIKMTFSLHTINVTVRQTNTTSE